MGKAIRHHSSYLEIVRDGHTDAVEEFLDALVDVQYGQSEGGHKQIGTLEAKCAMLFKHNGAEEMAKLRDTATAMISAAKKLCQEKKGIRYNVDRSLSTNEHVFSIVGPHTGRLLIIGAAALISTYRFFLRVLLWRYCLISKVRMILSLQHLSNALS